jgi:hypothetical protein
MDVTFNDAPNEKAATSIDYLLSAAIFWSA